MVLKLELVFAEKVSSSTIIYIPKFHSTMLYFPTRTNREAEYKWVGAYMCKKKLMGFWENRVQRETVTKVESKHIIEFENNFYSVLCRWQTKQYGRRFHQDFQRFSKEIRQKKDFVDMVGINSERNESTKCNNCSKHELRNVKTSGYDICWDWERPSWPLSLQLR